jgi:hypothetical protein
MTMAPTDDADDSTIVESDVPAESTVPEPAPARRPAPVVAPPPVRDHRQRRLTVASPIPALLAASMRDAAAGAVRQDAARPASPRAEAVPLATSPAQTTSRLAEDLQAELLRDDDGPEYVVEIDASKPEG